MQLVLALVHPGAQPDRFSLKRGYSHERHQLAEALQWLESEAEERVQTIATEREVEIGPFFVYVFFRQSYRLFEFYGCWLNGCPKGINSQTIHPLRNFTMATIHAMTIKRQK